MNKLQYRLTEVGIETSSTIDKNRYLEKMGATVKKVDGRIYIVFDVKGEEFDYIFYWSARLDSRENNFLHYIVARDNIGDEKTKLGYVDRLISQRNTGLSIKKDHWYFGKVTSVSWGGDSILSTRLNSDYLLNEKILELLRNKKRPKSIDIFQFKGHVHIKTPYYLPSSEDFEVINIIARHVKSAWY